MTDKKRLLETIESLKGKRILVVGDLMLDRFIYGSVSRISPEAPVPVVKVEHQREHLGGSGNVVRNINALGGVPLLVAVIGEDAEGMAIKKILKDNNLTPEGLVVSKERPTTIKTRVLAERQQVVRLDIEKDLPLDSETTAGVNAAVSRLIKEADAIIISDYNKGIIIDEVMNHVRKEIPDNIVLSVDPKPSNYRRYRDVTVITPNLKETAEMARMRIENDDDLAEAAQHIFKDTATKSLLVTLGKDGMVLFESAGVKPVRLQTRAREVFDVTGAGDTVIATFTLALAAGVSMYEAAEIANFAAGIVVGKIGTAAASSSELAEYINDHQY